MAAQVKSARNLCFTLNNWSESEYQQLVDMKSSKYIIIGKEMSKTGTPHLQGYVEFRSSKKFSTLFAINPRIHWEKRRGSPKQAAEYCKKDGVFFEMGTISHQGKRTDLDEVADLVKSGASDMDIADDYPKAIIKHGSGIGKLRYVLSEHRDYNHKPCVVWIWGSAGVGKTRMAVESHETYYIKDDSKWWDGYDRQIAIIIDDFDAKAWSYRDLLRLTDRYKYQAEIKGGSVKINSHYIYITCEHPPDYYWQDNCLAQVTRRLYGIFHLTHDPATVAAAKAEVQKGNTMLSEGPCGPDVKDKEKCESLRDDIT